MYEENTVSITFHGKARTGKTTVAELIRDCLQARGINVELVDPDHPDGYKCDLQSRVDAIKSRGTKFVLHPTERRMR